MNPRSLLPGFKSPNQKKGIMNNRTVRKQKNMQKINPDLICKIGFTLIASTLLVLSIKHLFISEF